MRASGISVLRWATVVLAVSCILQYSWVCGAATDAAKPDVSELRQQFDCRYQAWLQASAGWWASHRNASSRPPLPEDQAIEDMGPAVVPFIIKIFEREVSHPHWDKSGYPGPLVAEHRDLIMAITGKVFRDDEYREGRLGSDHEEIELYVKWWNEGRRLTPQNFQSAYSTWDLLLRNGKEKEAKKQLDDMWRYMGIEVLPLVMNAIRAGDDRLLPLVNKLMAKNVVGDNPTRESVLNWWAANEAHLTFPPVPPDSTPAEGK